MEAFVLAVWQMGTARGSYNIMAILAFRFYYYSKIVVVKYSHMRL